MTCRAAAFLKPVAVQSELSSAASKASEEREFLRSLNETLLANQKDFGCKLQAAQAALADKDAQLQDLQEQVGHRGLS
jgi:BRCA1-associated protein